MEKGSTTTTQHPADISVSGSVVEVSGSLPLSEVDASSGKVRRGRKSASAAAKSPAATSREQRRAEHQADASESQSMGCVVFGRSRPPVFWVPRLRGEMIFGVGFKCLEAMCSLVCHNAIKRDVCHVEDMSGVLLPYCLGPPLDHLNTPTPHKTRLHSW